MLTYNELLDITNDIEFDQSPYYDEDKTCYIHSKKDDVRLIYQDGKYVGWYIP